MAKLGDVVDDDGGSNQIVCVCVCYCVRIISRKKQQATKREEKKVHKKDRCEIKWCDKR